MRWYRIAVIGTVLIAAPIVLLRAVQPPDRADINANDNRISSGVLRDGVLTIDLVAGAGTWYPEGVDGPGHDVYAFGVADAALTNPGPLLRVPVGTEIRATIRNDLALPLTVHGLFDRPGTAVPLEVRPGHTASVRFRVTAAGTYYYWGTTRGAARLTDRFGAESQLIGALVVDEPGMPADDHIFVIGVESDSGATPVLRPLRAVVVNGRSWPHSFSSTVQLGDSVRMRWINISERFHPMHLHGFYFTVHARGDIAVDTLYDSAHRRHAVTELLEPGTTAAFTWVPDRPGNWLMHCHMTEHISPQLRRDAGNGAAHTTNHALGSMAGLVIGWRVRGHTDVPAAAGTSPLTPRSIRLLVQTAPRRFGDTPGRGFVIQQGDIAPAADSILIPGPPLVLARGQPVSINVVNRMSEPTSIHWHGIELDSYYDGVAGWSGEATRISPHIAPGDSFEVRFTPPRTGTFIYHSHFDEEHQITTGMYGAILVLDPGQRHDPATDQPWIIGGDGPGRPAPVVINGSKNPAFDMQVGTRYRVRLINIHPNMPVTIRVEQDSTPVLWRSFAKDGADLPVAQMRLQPAVQRIGVGETYDFELTPDRAGTLRVRLMNPLGVLVVSGEVRVTPGS